MEQYFPSKAEFAKLAKKGALVPVYREILADLETPVSAYLKLGDRPYSYLLESVEGGEKLARFSVIGLAPQLVFRSTGRRITISEPGRADKTFTTSADPLAELEKLLKRYKQPPMKGLPPFSGGAVGYMGYDTVRFIEKIPDKNKDVHGIPDSVFVFTDSLVVFDHINKKIKVVCNVRVDQFKNASDAYDSAVQKIDDEVRRLRSGLSQMRISPQPEKPVKLKVESNFTKDAFRAIVQKAKHYIKIGDIIQVVLSQKFSVKVHSHPFDIYRALRSINPSPYMFYLNFEGFQLAGSSPEIHVRCENGKAVVRPIAGTRRRGKNTAEDKALEKELLADPKERAEHLMLVDLGRNDLGRVCDFKTVKVPEFMVVERYSHVMHIVSHVEGLLKKGKTLYDLLRATFPAGTVSGAPKVRAMQIIDQLENRKRGFYAGIVGYFSYSGNLDSCIAIRTILIKDGVATVQAGAGIVADSDPSAEYEETVNKAKALVKAIEAAENGVAQ